MKHSQDFIKAYFLENRLEKRGISMAHVFDTLAEIVPLFMPKLKGASAGSIQQLEEVAGFELPHHYKYFLQKAGESLGNLKISYYDHGIKDYQFLDFNIHTVLKKYEELNYSNADKNRLKTKQLLNIAYIGMCDGVGYEDKLDMLVLDGKSSEIFSNGSRVDKSFNYLGLEDMLFYEGFLSLHNLCKMGYFKSIDLNILKNEQIANIAERIREAIFQISPITFWHPFSSDICQYFVVPHVGVYFIVEFSYHNDKFLHLIMNVYQKKDAQKNNEPEINAILNKFQSLSFVKEIGLKYYMASMP